MENEFWEKRYEANDTIYGKEPNAHILNLLLDGLKPGSILLPAEVACRR